MFLKLFLKKGGKKMEHKKLRMGAMKTVANSMWNKIDGERKNCPMSIHQNNFLSVLPYKTVYYHMPIVIRGVKACGKTPY
ncbi:hypothetical protein Avbf_09749 [Armadillidium vulgare]|nr:hypothetical protein Avbf_09749 [Armadillidium vulgare]